jgi:SNARE associated Golgi protein
MLSFTTKTECPRWDPLSLFRYHFPHVSDNCRLSLFNSPLSSFRPSLVPLLPTSIRVDPCGVRRRSQSSHREDNVSGVGCLSVLRLVGVVPWSGINVACGVCGVPTRDCVLGAFIGTLPWTAVYFLDSSHSHPRRGMPCYRSGSSSMGSVIEFTMQVAWTTFRLLHSHKPLFGASSSPKFRFFVRVLG